MSPGPGDVPHSRTCCFLDLSQPRKFVPVCSETECQFRSHCVKQFYDVCINDLSDHCSFTNCCKRSGILLNLIEDECFLGMLE